MRLLAALYRLVLLRLQGEARLLTAPEAGPVAEAIAEDEFSVTFDAGGTPVRLTRVAGYAPPSYTVFGSPPIDLTMVCLSVSGETLQLPSPL